jgi:hypothetical protein
MDKLSDLAAKLAPYLRGPRWIELPEPVYSSNFNGDVFSTVGSAGNNTLMNLSTEFGLPTKILSVKGVVQISDSASFGSSGIYAFFYSTAASTLFRGGVRSYGGNLSTVNHFECLCNPDGNIYYRFGASGTNTLTVTIYITGYKK